MCYLQDSPEKVFADAGIHQSEAIEPTTPRQPKRKSPRSTPPFVCQICFNDEPDQQTIFLLSCPSISPGSTGPTRHEFCQECYTEYVVAKVMAGESRSIECMESGCTQIVDEITITKLLTIRDKEKSGYYFPPLVSKFKTLLNRTYVEDNSALRFCPAPNCEYTIECHVSKKSLDTVIPSVTCQCGYQ